MIAPEFRAMVVDAMASLTPSEKARLAAELANSFYVSTRNQLVTDAQKAATPRILMNGADVTLDAAGKPVGFAGGGRSQFPILNFKSGIAAINSQVNSNQVDIYGLGGDIFLYDYLVDAAWATEVAAGRGLEGQQFSNSSGSTFKVYSTLAGAIADAVVVGYTGTNVATVFVKAGTYAAPGGVTLGSPTLNLSVRIIGESRERVVIGGGSGSASAWALNSTNAASIGYVYLENLTLIPNTATTATGGLMVGNGQRVQVINCTLQGSSAGSVGQWAVGYNGSVGGSPNLPLIVRGCRIVGTYGIRLNGTQPTAEESQITDNYFDGATVALSLAEECHVTGNRFVFCSTAIQLDYGTPPYAVHIVGNSFNDTTRCIVSAGNSGPSRVWILANTFSSSVFFIDVTSITAPVSGAPSTGTANWVIANNHGLGGTFIAFAPVLTSKQGIAGWVIANNSIGGVGSAFWTGDTAVRNPSNTWFDNWYNGQTVAPGGGNDYSPLYSVDGSLSYSLTAGIYWIDSQQPIVLGIGPFTARFGDTAVAVAVQKLTLPASSTNYVEVDTAGIASSNTTGFTAGRLPIVKMVTGDFLGSSIYTSHTDVAGVMYVATPAGGAGTPASNAEPYVTIGNSPNLTAERALTAGNGVGFTDGGANTTVTLNLKDLTGNWTQAGVFDISHAGNLTVLKHAALGALGAADPNLILNVKEQFNNPVGQPVAVGGQIITNLTANNSSGAAAMSFTNILQGGFEQTGIMSAVAAGFLVMGTGTIADDLRALWSAATILPGSRAKARYGAYVQEATGGGTLDAQYALYSEELLLGAANWFCYSVGSTPSFHGGPWTWGPIAAPATPAAGNLVVYNETGTQFFKVKDAAGKVYNTTHEHEFEAVVDGSTASTTVPFAVIRVPHAGVITGVWAKCAENKTIGATSWIGDVHKIPAANANTDGQGTTVYTTQANRPTIPNGSMYAAAALPDVTAVAAGDWLAFYSDQIGTNATFITVVVSIRYT